MDDLSLWTGEHDSVLLVKERTSPEDGGRDLWGDSVQLSKHTAIEWK